MRFTIAIYRDYRQYRASLVRVTVRLRVRFRVRFWLKVRVLGMGLDSGFERNSYPVNGTVPVRPDYRV